MEHEKRKAVPDPPRKRSDKKRTVAAERPPLSLTPKSPASPLEVESGAWYPASLPGLRRLAHTLVEREHVEDIVQSACVKFLRQCERRSDAPPADQVSQRLAAMVHDVVKDHYRKLEREARLMQQISGTREATRRWSATPRLAGEDEILTAIHAVLSKHVSEEDRQAWLIVNEQQFTTKEAVAALGKNAGAIRTAVYRANQILQQYLLPMGVTPDMLRGRDDT